MEGSASVKRVYPVSRITDEGRVGFSGALGPGIEQGGATGRGAAGGRVGQLNMCAKSIYPLMRYI